MLTNKTLETIPKLFSNTRSGNNLTHAFLVEWILTGDRSLIKQIIQYELIFRILGSQLYRSLTKQRKNIEIYYGCIKIFI